MSTLEFGFWAAAFAVTLVVIVVRNLRFSRALREVQALVEESRAKFGALLDELEAAEDKEQRSELMCAVRAEKYRVEELFADIKPWPSQGKRIYRYLTETEAFEKKAEKLAHPVELPT